MKDNIDTHDINNHDIDAIRRQLDADATGLLCQLVTTLQATGQPRQDIAIVARLASGTRAKAA